MKVKNRIGEKIMLTPCMLDCSVGSMLPSTSETRLPLYILGFACGGGFGIEAES